MNDRTKVTLSIAIPILIVILILILTGCNPGPSARRSSHEWLDTYIPQYNDFSTIDLTDIHNRLSAFHAVGLVPDAVVLSPGAVGVPGPPNGYAHGWYESHGLPQLDKSPGVMPGPFLP